MADGDEGSSDLVAWPDLSGRIDGAQHILPVRVYYEDTDFSGFVYHATYVRWAERGRTDYVRLIGLNQKAMFEGELADSGEDAEPSFFVVRRLELDYLKPAFMDDVLEIVTKVDEIGTASITLHQEIRRGGIVVFKAVVVIVLINASGRPVRLTDVIKDAFGEPAS